MSSKSKSIQEEIYNRSKAELHRPSTKISKNWTNIHTAKFTVFWNKLYIEILQKEINTDKKIAARSYCEMKINPSHSPFKRKKKKPPRHRDRSRTAPDRSAYQQSIDSYNAKTVFSADLLNTLCKSLDFGVFTLQNFQDERKEFESDIVSFWFSIVFTINHKKKHFLYLKYIKDEMRKKGKSGKIYQFNKIQISCDIEYAQKSQIINAKKSLLPKDVLIEIFKYSKPRKMLALYTYDVSFDSDPFDPKYLNISNMQWLCNFFGLETYFMRKLFKILISFLYCEEVDKYIEKTKTYDKNWKEWQDAQLDLNIMQIHNQMTYLKKRR